MELLEFGSALAWDFSQWINPEVVNGRSRRVKLGRSQSLKPQGQCSGGGEPNSRPAVANKGKPGAKSPCVPQQPGKESMDSVGNAWGLGMCSTPPPACPKLLLPDPMSHVLFIKKDAKGQILIEEKCALDFSHLYGK